MFEVCYLVCTSSVIFRASIRAGSRRDRSLKATKKTTKMTFSDHLVQFAQFNIRTGSRAGPRRSESESAMYKVLLQIIALPDLERRGPAPLTEKTELPLSRFYKTV
jgi:hypothetical protein